FSSITPPPPAPTLFPYTTLFRSHVSNRSVRPHEPPLVLLCPTLGETLGDDPLHAVAILGVHARHEPVVAGGRPDWDADEAASQRSEEHTSELQSRFDLVCRLLLE